MSTKITTNAEQARIDHARKINFLRSFTRPEMSIEFRGPSDPANWRPRSKPHHQRRYRGGARPRV